MKKVALTPTLQISPEHRLLRWRELPVPGKILKKEGDQVNPEEIVAITNILGDLLVLKVPEKMGIEPNEVISGLQIKLSQKINKGDLLCVHKGLFGLLKTEYRSPEDGIVEFISDSTGHIGLRLASTTLTIIAYIPGIVKEVKTNLALCIEYTGTYIQGIFGVGGEKFGRIYPLDLPDNKIIVAKDIPLDVKNSIIIARSWPDATALQQAVALGAVGMVCGSIEGSELSSFLGHDIGVAITGGESTSFTFFITEGFGNLTMGSRPWNMFLKAKGSIASMNGATQVRAGAVRPEIILPPQSAGEQHQVVSQSLEIGTKVRIIRHPYFGKTAIITELPSERVVLATGASTRVLRAKIEDNSKETITVPRQNVEIIG
jgi:hypothetical protein